MACVEYVATPLLGPSVIPRGDLVPLLPWKKGQDVKPELEG